MKYNSIIVMLYCGGADGAAIYINGEYGYHINYGYDVDEALREVFSKIDITKPVCISTIDDDEMDEDNALEYFHRILDEDPEEVHNKFTVEEMDALKDENKELFLQLFKERCGGRIDGESD